MRMDSTEHTGLVLQTKLYRPPLPADLVTRGGLIELLDRERNRPLTLVSAPAGYGKSVLVASWLEHNDWSSAWLSLDSDDGDLRSFLNYFVAALHKLYPGVCEQTLSLLKASELPTLATLAGVLSNEIDAIEEPFILVLDDYHRIDTTSPVHDLLEKLLAHPPIPLHLIIATRLDPPLSLERQRALGQVTDIRLLDLRLNQDETRLLLQKTVMLEASDTVLHNLDRELEGWVVGLKLVALALRHFSDSDELLSQFSGGTREMQAYLVGEVLDRLPPQLRDCLTRTAILNRFCAPLCDALFASENGQAFLQSAYNDNLFLIPLDSRNDWFRYHHLFQELLQRELTAQLDEAQISDLHLTASRWFEDHAFIDEAIRHALAAGDELAAVEIVERHRRAELDADNWYAIERWLEMLPPVKEQRPELLLARAWIAYERFQITALPDLVQRIFVLLDESKEGTPLWGELHFLKGAALYWSGDGKASHECFATAQACLPAEHQLFLGLTCLLDGLSSHMCGDYQGAVDTLQHQLQRASSQQSTYYTRLLSGLYFAHMMRGNLASARSEAVRIESVATSGRIQYTVAWSWYMRACTYLHRCELEEAAKHFSDAAEHCYILHRIAAIESFSGLALCQQLMGQQQAAKQTLGKLRSFAMELNDPNLLEIVRASQARFDVLRGNPENSVVWAGSDNTPPEFAEQYMWMEVPALARARVWIALGGKENLGRACELLENMVARNTAWNLVNQAIEAGALHSVALEKSGRSEEALDRLEETLRLAAPGGWVRPFVELGSAMATLLSRFNKGGQETAFSQLVLSAFSDHSLFQSQSQPSREQPLVVEKAFGIKETLTKREQTILELLAQRLQNKEIAAQLFVSPETVKSHIKRLYQKLGVHNRRDAAAIAIQLLKPNNPA